MRLGYFGQGIVCTSGVQEISSYQRVELKRGNVDFAVLQNDLKAFDVVPKPLDGGLFKEGFEVCERREIAILRRALLIEKSACAR